MQSSQEFLKKVEDAAKAEIADEDFRERVEKKKAQLRAYVPFWYRIFPWKM